MVGTTILVPAEQGQVSGAVPLIPIQHWFFEQQLAQPEHFNQALLLESRERLDAALLEQALGHLLEHHDGLRLRFTRSEAGWQQCNQEQAEAEVLLRRIDLREWPEEEVAERLEAEATQLQASLSLEAGPLLRVALFELGAGGGERLLLVIHHLVVDGVSWRILLEDLQTAYQQLRRGEAVKLPAKTTSFKRWAELLKEYAESESVGQELSYWEGEGRRRVKELPVDYEGGSNSEASAGSVTVRLSEEETRVLLQEVPEVYHTEINDVLLTALVEGYGKWSGERMLLVDLEGHGREELGEEVDVSRTVGWFTTMYPVRLEIKAGSSVGVALKGIKEQLRGIPQRGIGYGLLRYVRGAAEEREQLRGASAAEVSFNYLGQVDQVFTERAAWAVARESSGLAHDPSGLRAHLIDVSGIIGGGSLQVTWVYSEAVHRRGTIEELAQGYLEALQELLAHCQLPEAGGFTPSDFPLAKLEQQELDGLLAADKQVADLYPLSPMQRGMLFHSLYAPESGVYCTQLSCVLEGDLNYSAFEQAWQRVVDTHPILRTAFVWEGLETPVQVVGKRVTMPIERADWREQTESEQQEQLSALLAADQQRGFQLTKAPLMRLTLVRLSEQRHQLIWNHHHLLLDGWCLPLLLKDVFALYEGLRQGVAVQLPPSRPYKDYIGWLQQQDLGQAESYWREKLKGFTAPTELGLERSGAASGFEEKEYSEQRLKLSEAATSGLQQLARGQQLTLNTIVQGAWGLLLSRYSGAEDVVFGAVVSGRPAELRGVEQMLGLFINTLPVRVRVREEMKVGEWLRELQGEQVELRQYEYSPLVAVQGWSEVERGRSLFESLLVFENYPVAASLREQGGSLKISEVGSRRADELFR